MSEHAINDLLADRTRLVSENAALKREVAELRAALERMNIPAEAQPTLGKIRQGLQERDRLLGLLKMVMADPACHVPRTWCPACASMTPIVEPGSPDSRCCSVCGGDLAEIGGEVGDV